MLWLFRLWLVVLALVLGWALICYALTRNRDYLWRARAAIRWSAYVAGLIALFWLARRLLF
ncbi:hypothetical protein [Crenobacter cavernae]|uniref:Uncharacterized protein n=1 Tax=Crenobacter cavernae TaxID=2290923 RepID=A0A345Y486_9NEIS|nr:hypothetical protein [Crenobacter cavernae]AXK38738.1 hypothetical protein DWG20_04445 [Crenobacter cavernae]